MTETTTGKTATQSTQNNEAAKPVQVFRNTRDGGICFLRGEDCEDALATFPSVIRDRGADQYEHLGSWEEFVDEVSDALAGLPSYDDQDGFWDLELLFGGVDR